MPATYTSSLRLTKPAVGDTNWGTTVNSGFTDLTDSAIAGYATVSMPSNADYTLTSVNGAADEARSMMLNITSAVSLTTTRNVICPTASKLYFVKNATTGSQSIVFKTSGGSGITIPNGSTAALACNGTNVIAAFDWLSSISFSGTITGTFSGPLNGTVGATTPNTGAFTNLSYTGTLTGGTGVVNLGSGQFYKDASGNIGVGVTPNTVTATHFQMPAASVVASKGDNYSFASNAYYNSAWKYATTAAATQYQQAGGIHYWFTAPSGTVDTNITFTERGRLSSTGLQISAAARTPPVAVTFSATAMTVDCSLSNVFTTTFTANVTTAPTFSNPGDGQTLNWFITQDATGGRTMTWPASFKWPGGTAGVLSTGANAADLLVATYRSSTGFWYATLSKGFA
jgi:hypothetical protein